MALNEKKSAFFEKGVDFKYFSCYTVIKGGKTSAKTNKEAQNYVLSRNHP